MDRRLTFHHPSYTYRRSSLLQFFSVAPAELEQVQLQVLVQGPAGAQALALQFPVLVPGKVLERAQERALGKAL